MPLLNRRHMYELEDRDAKRNSCAIDAGSVRRRVPDKNAYRRRVEAIAWVVDLRTVREDAQHIHFRDDIDVSARLGDAVYNGEVA